MQSDILRDLITEIVRAELGRVGLLQTPGDLLSTEQAATHCGVAVGTVRRWIHEERLPTQHAGRRLRIRRTDLEEMLATPRLRGPRKSRPSPEIAADRMLRRRSLAKTA